VHDVSLGLVLAHWRVSQTKVTASDKSGFTLGGGAT